MGVSCPRSILTLALQWVKKKKILRRGTRGQSVYLLHGRISTVPPRWATFLLTRNKVVSHHSGDAELFPHALVLVLFKMLHFIWWVCQSYCLVHTEILTLPRIVVCVLVIEFLNKMYWWMTPNAGKGLQYISYPSIPNSPHVQNFFFDVSLMTKNVQNEWLYYWA